MPVIRTGGKNVLHDGIYEQLISKGLERELEKSDKYHLTAPTGYSGGL